MENSFFDKIRKEISETQQRRQKIDLLKITFVSALLGFGSIKFDNFRSFYQILYVAPLMSVFLDLLAMGEHFSIRRMGAYLRLCSESEHEQEYEDFISRNLDKYFIWGSRGFSFLSFLGAIFLVININKGISLWEGVWFFLLFIFFLVITVKGRQRLHRFSQLTSISQSVHDKVLEEKSEPDT